MNDVAVETVLAGRITTGSLVASGERVLELLRERPAPIELLDVSRATALDVSLLRAAGRILKALQSEGLREVLVVTQMRSARMLALALGFGGGMSIRVFATREEAIRYIDMCEKPRPRQER